jgi:GTPase SAR1 family protein
MVFFNYATMQMAAKIVYYGPGLCGKTTNLHHIYGRTAPDSRGEMVSLETETDRTLFFDLLPLDGLAGKTAIPIATGGSPAHQLVIDHGLRPLFASVGALTTSIGVYGTDSSFENGVPHHSLVARIQAAVSEAITLSERIQVAADSSSSTFVES